MKLAVKPGTYSDKELAKGGFFIVWNNKRVYLCFNQWYRFKSIEFFIYGYHRSTYGHPYFDFYYTKVVDFAIIKGVFTSPPSRIGVNIEYWNASFVRAMNDFESQFVQSERYINFYLGMESSDVKKDDFDFHKFFKLSPTAEPELEKSIENHLIKSFTKKMVNNR